MSGGLYDSLILRRGEDKTQELLRALDLKTRCRALNEIGSQDTQFFTLNFRSRCFVSYGCKM